MASHLQTKLPTAELIAGRYRYVRGLGEGATGRVWLVEDTASSAASPVLRALKWVEPAHADRVRSEFALLSRIAHPNLAAVHDLVRVVAQERGTRPMAAGWGLVSDYVVGSAAQIAAAGWVGRRDGLVAFVLRVLDGVARALAELHGRGFVHGDIKQENVLVDHDASQVTVIDLGLARPAGIETTLSGTPRYMAPELFRGELTPAADVYALAVLLRRTLEPELGASERTVQSPASMLARALQPLAAVAGWVPQPLAALLARMSAVDRAERPASGSELLDAISDLARVLPSDLAPALSSKRARKRVHPARAATLGALPLVGQADTLLKLEAALRERALIVVWGAHGAGRSRVIRDAVFALQLRSAESEASIPSYRQVSELPEQIDQEACVLHVLDADGISVAEAHALARATELAGRSLWIVLERTHPLEQTDLSQWSGAPRGTTVNDAWQARVGGLSTGHDSSPPRAAPLGSEGTPLARESARDDSVHARSGPLTQRGEAGYGTDEASPPSAAPLGSEGTPRVGGNARDGSVRAGSGPLSQRGEAGYGTDEASPPSAGPLGSEGTPRAGAESARAGSVRAGSAPLTRDASHDDSAPSRVGADDGLRSAAALGSEGKPRVGGNARDGSVRAGSAPLTQRGEAGFGTDEASPPSAAPLGSEGTPRVGGNARDGSVGAGSAPLTRDVSHDDFAPSGLGADDGLRSAAALGGETSGERASGGSGMRAGSAVHPARGCVEVEVPALDDGAVAELLRVGLGLREVSEAQLVEAQRLSAGLAGRLCRELSAALLEGADVEDVLAVAARMQGSGALELALPQAGREVGQLLALAGGSLPRSSLTLPDLLIAQGVQSLSTLGACTRAPDGRLLLRSDVRLQLYAAMTSSERARHAQMIIDPQADPRALAFLAHARGQDVEALRRLAALAEEMLRAGDPAGVDALLSDAAPLWSPHLSAARSDAEPPPRAAENPAATSLEVAASRLLVLQADARRALGRYTQALQLLPRSAEPGARLLRAEVSRLQGASEQAYELARAVLDAPPPSAAEVRRGAHALLARLCLDRGDAESCREHARLASEREDDAPALRAAEVLALLELSEGHLDSALARAEAATAHAQHRGARAAEARLCAVVGSVQRARGQLSAAARQFARASELASAQGELHAAVSFTVNHATAQLDAGQLGPALSNLRKGASGLLRLGRERDTARVLANWLLAAQLLGDFEHALALAERMSETAQRVDEPWALAFGLLSCAEMLLERGDHAAAEARMRQLPELAALPPGERATALARSASVWATLRRTERAEAQLLEAEALLPGAPAALAETLLARAALSRARGDNQAGFEAAERALAEAHARGEFPVLVQALSACAEAARALGNSELVHLRYAELRALLDGAALTLTAAERALLRNVRGYRAALAAMPARSAARLEVDTRFGQLTQYVKRLTSETRLHRLYERILEAAIALSGAERGLLLRPDPQGRVRARAQLGAAGVDAGTLASAVWSQSIVERVLSSGQLLASVDAAEDQQLVAASSVHALALRSVLALPMRTHDAVLGVIYLEDRLRPFAFGEPEIALLSDFADLASLTITGVERLRRERRAVRRLSLTQARLAAQVQTQAIELRALKQAHEPVSERTGIVAESPAMREVLSLALRVAASDVPVLIRGESGTGKELVARAIHAHSSRAERPFVSESCGAIPETLLESALFGHVKGAFTGADRRRVGLFEAANGGTLFLDEIAEMSPGMQTRLLRVLQEGEVRPVGGERTLRVDVRVVAATHRDLDAMVAEGTFREDLFYRLAVVDLRLPPLRERASDVIPLVQHFIQKHAAGRTPRLERRAIERLMTRAWPGNVRQLENEVRRALVLGGDVLREEHFGFAQGKEAGSSSDLNLRSQVDELERKLIKRAFDLAKGNQTRAAELLGVSRFGLQKMVKRLGITAS